MKLTEFLLILFFFLLFTTGCDKSPLQPDQKEHENLQVVEACDEELVEGLQGIPQFNLDVSYEHQGRQDVEVLAESIAAKDGKTIIGLKAPESKRVVENNGIRSALTAQQFEDALHMLCSQDVKIIYVYKTFGAASVQMETEQVFELFDHPRVDYISKPVMYEIQ